MHIKPKDSILESADPATAEERRAWDFEILDQSAAEFVKRGQYDRLLIWLMFAADRSPDFRDALVSFVGRLKPDKRGTWSKTELRLLLLHDLLYQSDADPARTRTREYAARVLKRTLGPRAIDNQLTEARKQMRPEDLPEFLRPILRKQLKAGGKRQGQRKPLTPGARRISFFK